MTALQDQLERSGVLGRVREPLAGGAAWLVGGTLRDVAMGRTVDDVDVAVVGDAQQAARRLARAHRAHVFPLSERFGAWRVVSRDRSWQADLTPVRDGSIEADLDLRDFTVNAMAWPVDGERAVLVDPHGGMRDIDQRLLRVVGERAYTDDPLRTLRMARFGCELGFDVDPDTLRMARDHAAQITDVAPERVYYELRRLIASDDPLRGVELMDAGGLIDVVLPELSALKGVGQNSYHQHDVWGHTCEVLRQLVEIERDLTGAFGELGPEIEAELARPLADELTRGQALRFAALFHDIGKPETRTVNDEGRVLFWGHDEAGARISIDICRRLHASSALGDYLAALARHHLRLGFLVHERPLGRRHAYRYNRSCEPVEVEVTVLSIADRLATRGPRTKPEAIDAHMQVARELAPAILQWRAEGPPEPLVRGDELIDELALESGPDVGRLIEVVREATYAGEVTTREQALELARSSL